MHILLRACSLETSPLFCERGWATQERGNTRGPDRKSIPYQVDVSRNNSKFSSIGVPSSIIIIISYRDPGHSPAGDQASAGARPWFRRRCCCLEVARALLWRYVIPGNIYCLAERSVFCCDCVGIPFRVVIVYMRNMKLYPKALKAMMAEI